MLRILSLLFLSASWAGVSAQSTTPYTDAATGITFQQYTSANGFSFGIALPEVAGTDFIGQISASTTGWAAVTLTGSMRNSLLAVAWPNGDNIVSSLRTTTGYSNPGVYKSDAVLKPISAGTSINSTGFTYTFLCEGCIIDGMAFDATAETGILGYALSTTAPTSAADSAAALQIHSSFGIYGFDVAGAKSAEFPTWAALAESGNSTIPTPPGGGNGTTTPPVSGNATIPISNSTYDYIVVGGGASGLVVSQRLAETGKSVLVLERGGPSFYSSGGDLVVPWNDTLTVYEVPGLFNSLSSFPGNNGYCSDTPAIAGCILGGGTTVNGLQFVRPPSSDFDDKWPQGWKWADVEPAAERLYERNPGDTSPSTDGKYYDNDVWDVASDFFGSAGWTEVDTNEQPDEKFQVYSHPSINTIGGLRAGPVRTYLPLAVGLSNFKLQLHTKVIRTVRTGSTITGVEVEDSEGQREIININQGGKVILAAGAMSSPRILFNSGIGPKDQINIVKSGTTGVTLPAETDWINSPVGNVRDHAYIVLTFKVNKNMTNMSPKQFTDPSAETLALYEQGSGPLAQSFTRGMTYTTITNDDGHKTRVQTHIFTTTNNTISFLVMLTHGLTSTGTLGITPEGNTEWTVSPYLNTDSDKQALTTAVEQMLAISRQSNSSMTYIGSANATGASIVASSKPLGASHMTGTTIMGEDDGTKDGNSVVDTNCKVYGTDNLFVVDAGMHPDLPTGNTQAIVMVAAEKAVERIIALGSSSTNETTTNPVEVVSTGSSSTVLPSLTTTATLPDLTGTTTLPSLTSSVGSSSTGSASTKPSSTKPAPTKPASIRPAYTRLTSTKSTSTKSRSVKTTSTRSASTRSASATPTGYRGRPVRGSGSGRWGWQ